MVGHERAQEAIDGGRVGLTVQRRRQIVALARDHGILDLGDALQIFQIGQAFRAVVIDRLLNQPGELLVEGRVLLQPFVDGALSGVGDHVGLRPQVLLAASALLLDHLLERGLVEDVHRRVQLHHLRRRDVGVQQFLDARLEVAVVHRFRVAQLHRRLQIDEALEVVLVGTKLLFGRLGNEAFTG